MSGTNRTLNVRPDPGEEAGLALETVILLIFGVFMLLFGMLLSRFLAGALPYSPDGAYGLFLVLTAFQVITLGKTPYGDVRRSGFAVLAGIAAALLGMASCFVPGRLTDPVRLLVGMVLTTGGLSLFLQLALSREKARRWLRLPGVPRHLAVGCGLVYLLSVVLGLVTLRPGYVPGYGVAGLLLADGFGLFYLAWAIQAVSRLKPPKGREEPSVAPGERRLAGRSRLLREASLSPATATLILLAVLLSFLGLVLLPVNLGLLNFSPDGLQGLLLVIFAIQMLSLGETPVGRFRRSWALVVFGVMFVGLGAFSCLVPGVLTHHLRVLLALLNLAAGSVFFARRFVQQRRDRQRVRAEAVSPILVKLRGTQAVLNGTVIAFGITMLVPGLVPGLLNAVIIVANGLLLFRLAAILGKLESR
ncbi:MAG: hypothetical protein KA419_15570 [Acidobacteria bacterium]|nr:hypothetical protein [Acidobacteriota bacterium]